MPLVSGTDRYSQRFPKSVLAPHSYCRPASCCRQWQLWAPNSQLCHPKGTTFFANSRHFRKRLLGSQSWGQALQELVVVTHERRSLFSEVGGTWEVNRGHLQRYFLMDLARPGAWAGPLGGLDDEKLSAKLQRWSDCGMGPSGTFLTCHSGVIKGRKAAQPKQGSGSPGSLWGKKSIVATPRGLRARTLLARRP